MWPRSLCSTLGGGGRLSEKVRHPTAISESKSDRRVNPPQRSVPNELTTAAKCVASSDAARANPDAQRASNAKFRRERL